MHAVGQAAGLWLPLHEVVKTVLTELGDRKALRKPHQPDAAPALQAES